MESLAACITEVGVVPVRFMRHSNASAVEPFPTEVVTHQSSVLRFRPMGHTRGLQI